MRLPSGAYLPCQVSSTIGGDSSRLTFANRHCPPHAVWEVTAGQFAQGPLLDVECADGRYSTILLKAHCASFFTSSTNLPHPSLLGWGYVCLLQVYKYQNSSYPNSRALVWILSALRGPQHSANNQTFSTNGSINVQYSLSMSPDLR